MTTNKKPPGSIHKIREFELEKIRLADEFDILQIVGEGWFGKILLVEHRATDTEMVLKALPKPYVSIRDFYREFHYGLHLGLHKNIVTTYDVAFETAGFYVFTQEYAPLGDLTSNVTENGIGEMHSKRVAKQIASALDYMHSKDIVHRDVKLDNVLIYRSDFSKVKLCDFGESFENGTMVERRNEWLPYSPPEVLQVETEGTYKADPSHDVWQFGIVIFVCLTGCLPWQKAASDDPRYVRYIVWQASNMMLPLRKTPKLFKLLSSRGCRMFRKFLDPRSDRRPRGLGDLSKFLDDRWLTKGAEKDLSAEPDELCPSMYSFHSSPDEKNKLLSTLAEHGIETTVDRNCKKNRIKDWIESSIITEDDEEEDSGSATPSSSVSREPVAGHISSVRADEAKKEIRTTIKDASNKHFDPRTGALQQGPSEMGTVYRFKSMGDIANGKRFSYGSSNSGSIATLASRNDLISSEGQSYHSEWNLDMTADNQRLVNSPLNISLINNNTRDISDANTFNESVVDRRATNNFKDRKVEQLNQRHYSSSALNIINSHNSHNNSLKNATKAALSSTFQSLATISVPEVNEQLLNNSQIKDSGYGSNEKLRPTGSTKIYNSSAFGNGSDPNILESGPLNTSQTLPAKDRVKMHYEITKRQNFNKRETPISMKDTPYDRVNAVRRGK